MLVFSKTIVGIDLFMDSIVHPNIKKHNHYAHI